MREEIAVKEKKTLAKTHKKNCFSFRNCCFCCLGILVLFIISLLILASLSGLVRIPLLSSLLYGDGPKPLRVVLIQTVDNKYFENLFKTAGETNQSQIVVSENILSFWINDFANKENNVLAPEDKRTKGSQIALEDGYAELFYKPLSPKTALTVKITPVQNEYKAQKIKIGKLRVPVFAANFFFSRFLDFNSMYNSSGIKSIKLEPGRVVIGIDPEFFKGENPEEAPVPFIPQ
ncbi:hypothetical protein KJ713_00085 [Patescibacteria group bacterium]|nr:hypothetical protein [Patescibacteria group bacterium]